MTVHEEFNAVLNEKAGPLAHKLTDSPETVLSKVASGPPTNQPTLELDGKHSHLTVAGSLTSEIQTASRI